MGSCTYGDCGARARRFGCSSAAIGVDRVTPVAAHQLDTSTIELDELSASLHDDTVTALRLSAYLD